MDTWERLILIEEARKKGDTPRVIELSTNQEYFMNAVRRFAQVVNDLGEKAEFTEIFGGLGEEGLELMSKAGANFSDLRSWCTNKRYLSWDGEGPYYLTPEGKRDLLNQQS